MGSPPRVRSNSTPIVFALCSQGKERGCQQTDHRQWRIGAASTAAFGSHASPRLSAVSVPRAPKAYVPKRRSGNWAVVIALAGATDRSRPGSPRQVADTANLLAPSLLFC